MDSNEALQSYKQPSVSSGRQSDMYKTTQSNVVEWPSHHLESRVRPQSEEQPTCSQRQPNESVHGPLEEIEEERQRKKAEQMAFNRRNEPEDKRKKRLAAQAERSRLRRMKETEERRLERLANDTERRKLRRSTETEEQRLLRLRSLADVRRKQRAQNNNLLKQHHSSQEEFGANSREVLEENVTGNPSDVARNDAFVAFSTQEATPEADPLQHSGTRDAFSGQRSMINFKDLISQRLNTFEDEFQHNASVPHLDESASRPLPSTSAYVPLKDLTIQPLHDEYVLLTPDPALRVHLNGAIENNLNALPPQSLPPFSHSHVEHHSNIPFTVLPSTSTELSPTQDKLICKELLYLHITFAFQELHPRDSPFSFGNMDLRYECTAIENMSASLSTLIGKTLDDLELTPSFIHRAENYKVSVEDVKKLEQIVGVTLSNTSKIYEKVQAIEDLLYYIIRNAKARGTLKTMPTPPPIAFTVKINNDSEENKVDGCTDTQLDCSADQKALEHVESETELRMKADAPQRGRRRSRSAVRYIKKVSRRLSLSKSRFPRAEKAGKFDADSTLPVER
ncbi:unnamed protein product [Cylicocyclus nassatus]|uniref:Uncharacterized protein n=1 Tax=Cylicocyclus nassatus TaxID=53992 RepID=A0AA36HB20_CYLNA|nr:unnamed protein product [Cylicocyclus nassatus]